MPNSNAEINAQGVGGATDSLKTAVWRSRNKNEAVVCVGRIMVWLLTLA
jgi:hypothetical protein